MLFFLLFVICFCVFCWWLRKVCCVEALPYAACWAFVVVFDAAFSVFSEYPVFHCCFDDVFWDGV